jgi:circadian clock protein KaiC
MFITFEEFPQSLYRDAESLGWNLPEIEAAGKLRIMFTSPKVLQQSLITPESNLLHIIHEIDIRRVVVDSLTHFTQQIADEHDLRQVYHQVTSALRREGVTAIYLGEEMRSDFTTRERGRLSFVVDTMIMLRYLEIDSAIDRAIVVLKMRSSAHDTAIRSYKIGANGITIGKPLEGKSGLLSGLTQRSLISTVRDQ